MAEDWAANVKKYVPDADEGIIAGIVRYCGIALQKRDSSLVSFSDPAETKRVRESFLKKKLGLTQSDEKLDAAITAVGVRMKGEKFRNRVTVYYLLAENFGKLGMFSKTAKAAPAAGKVKAPAAGKSKASAAKSGAGLVAGTVGAVSAAAAGAAGAVGAAATGAVSGAKAVGETAADAAGAVGSAALGVAGAAGAAALGAAGAVVSGAVSGAKVVGGTAADAAGAAVSAVGSVAGAASSGISGAAQALTGGIGGDSEEGDSGWGWLIWLLLAALALGVLWWLFRSKPATPVDGGVTTEQTATATDAAGTPPPAEGTVAIPTGAGVTTETRDGKPVVKVYFSSGKTEIAPAFDAAAGALKSYLDGHSGSSLAVSGFNDKTGNAALNAALSKKRAQAVKAALVTGGIADASVALVKPADSTDASASNDAARRVEVVVK